MTTVMRLAALTATLVFALSVAAEAALSLNPIGTGAASPFMFSLDAPTQGITAGSQCTVTLKVDVPDGYYLYRDKMNVVLLGPETLTLVRVDWPEPKEKYDPTFEKVVRIYPSPLMVPIRIRVAPSAAPATAQLQLQVDYQGCSPTLCYTPKQEILTADVTIVPGAAVPAPTLAAALTAPPLPEPTSVAVSTRSLETASRVGWFDVGMALKAHGLIVLLLILFASGVALDFVACIYPMIPVTIAAIGAKENRHPLIGLSLSLCYVAGIVITFIVLGVIASLIGGAVGLTFSNPWVAAVIAAVFVAMGLSMLGLYEIRVPSGLLQAARLKQTKGYAGAFLMGLLGGVIATPCGTPVLVGLATFVATTRNPALGALLFGVFGLGIGSLFIVIGTFWGALNLLPKSGQWMENVRKVFGVLMFAVALWLLTPVLPTLYLQWTWTAGLILLGILIGGLARLEVGAGLWAQLRKGLGLIAFVIGLVMLLGLLGLVPLGGLMERSRSGGESPASAPIDWQMPGLETPQVVESAGKPVLLYFAADWCAACEDLKKYAFTDPRVVGLSRQFRMVMFDGTDQLSEKTKGIEDRYGVLVYPTILFFDEQGRLISDGTVVGYVSPSKMANQMQAVLDVLSGRP